MPLQRYANTPVCLKMFRAEVEDIVADDYGKSGLLHQISRSLFEIQDWIINVNLAVIYLLTKFYIKHSHNY